MNKKLLLTAGIAVIVLLAAFFLLTQSKSETVKISTKVNRGPFEVLVYSSGQLEAQHSEDIVVPDNLRDRDIRIYEIKITDLVEEGTVVDSGDYVATLDQKAVEETLTNAREELEQAYNEFEDAKLDSNLTLSNVRDQIINAREEVEEKKIVLDESVYESPAVIRKAEMDLDKSKRKLEQEVQGYDLKQRQAVSKVERKKIELRRLESRVDKLNDVYHSLVITAPKAGMVIYGKDRTREKIKVGSTVSPWMPVIATLPDLSSMLSTTFVNEIDISKVKTGQKVILGIDALPEKELEGEVVSVANIGQPMPKSDAKVFEVKIRVFGDVSDLKPAMTTSNQIQTGFYTDTLFIPAEAVFSNDTMQYVYVENGGVVKQVVDLGDQNENYFLVRKGLNAGDVVLLTEPPHSEDIAIVGEEIYQEIKERKLREEEEAKKALEEEKKKPFKLQKKASGNSGNVIIIG
ncbi:Multidrug efflux pump subunit AcrA (membrane-fusion protein) [Mariniphaga anaerophila]|uniref:Multidrug efflux pump subunit AcrA (Membrane-fusion protein) n=1 Tax=Mariniphaga anaerophila TaxID=1484053 RepID=A0A1M4YKU1_9BACT|nr:HlyD family efflux transporter periplasmic adaptor subunit [Mariniphaga anaerophila]SHF06298.1 Multidrug efflux pump subunit AcrA (membrane-fusion protein) [Mariniphaga anaerophila]